MKKPEQKNPTNIYLHKAQQKNKQKRRDFITIVLVSLCEMQVFLFSNKEKTCCWWLILEVRRGTEQLSVSYKQYLTLTPAGWIGKRGHKWKCWFFLTFFWKFRF